MALETVAEGNVVSRLASAVKLPRMAKVRQLLDHSHIEEEKIPQVVHQELNREEMRNRIRPGMRLAITCGSRGVANIARITKAIVDFVKECGGEPFVFPSMGSHGGATAQGQVEILTGYGVTEDFLGCPIRATMEVVEIGKTPEGMPVYVDRYAYEADGIILCGRVKAHTAFRGPFESGIMKMAVIGMGKQKGAETVHQNGFYELGRMLPVIGKVILDHVNVIGAVGLVENAFDQTCIIKGMLREEIYEEEPKLLTLSKQRLGCIYFDNIDVLVVDRIGKDISGDGMDPNITGRFAVPYIEGEKKIQHIAVLDLTEETHGNCNGIGLADVTTKRLVDKIDVDCTYPNVCTSTVLCTPKIPLFTHTDQACIQIALKTCNYIDREHTRIVRIKDTMNLEEIYISESMVEEAVEMEHIEFIEGPGEWGFNKSGNLW
ncbi:MAG: nickel-dependent lactate racemase [Lachnospiraceae bacterium]|nr:nickel-dependent lactate racemase [Lachnospiraceae bacterium]